MTRRRDFNPHSYYHVILRGNNRQPIFKAKEDMHELKRAFLHVHADYPFTILAWCFMTNHYHILIKPLQDPLHKIMSLVNRRYSASYAKRYRHIGRIYQKRYFAKEVDSRLGFIDRQQLYPSQSHPDEETDGGKAGTVSVQFVSVVLG